MGRKGSNKIRRHVWRHGLRGGASASSAVFMLRIHYLRGSDSPLSTSAFLPWFFDDENARRPIATCLLPWEFCFCPTASG